VLADLAAAALLALAAPTAVLADLAAAALLARVAPTAVLADLAAAALLAQGEPAAVFADALLGHVLFSLLMIFNLASISRLAVFEYTKKPV
jgi:hypothetical protein